MGDDHEQPTPVEEPAEPEPEIPVGEAEWEQKGARPFGLEKRG